MYIDELPEILWTTTIVRIKYDCCNKEHDLKWKDADKNFAKNNGQHICRSCWLKYDNPFTKEDVKEKTKKTNLERYGIEKPVNLPKNIASRRERIWDNVEVKDKIVKKRRDTS